MVGYEDIRTSIKNGFNSKLDLVIDKTELISKLALDTKCSPKMSKKTVEGLISAKYLVETDGKITLHPDIAIKTLKENNQELESLVSIQKELIDKQKEVTTKFNETKAKLELDNKNLIEETYSLNEKIAQLTTELETTKQQLANSETTNQDSLNKLKETQLAELEKKEIENKEKIEAVRKETKELSWIIDDFKKRNIIFYDFGLKCWRYSLPTLPPCSREHVGTKPSFFSRHDKIPGYAIVVGIPVALFVLCFWLLFFTPFGSTVKDTLTNTTKLIYASITKK